MTIEQLIGILQASVGPTVLISGVGLLLLSMVNRLARPIDRIRLLGRDLKLAAPAEAPLVKEQINILFKRCQYLQRAIALAIISIASVSVIILLLFSIYLFDVNLSLAVEIIFAFGIVALLGSLAYFFLDIKQTLYSVTIEMNRIKRF